MEDTLPLLRLPHRAVDRAHHAAHGGVIDIVGNAHAEDIFPLRVGQVDVGNSLCVGADGDGVLGIILKVVAADADLPQRVEECVNRAVALAGNFCGFEAVAGVLTNRLRLNIVCWISVLPSAVVPLRQHLFFMLTSASFSLPKAGFVISSPEIACLRTESANMSSDFPAAIR